jgi:hypothetical protein
MIALLIALALLNLLQETSAETTTAFNDLGKLLLGGMVAAIVLAVGFTLVRFRMQDKKPQTSNFISISSPQSVPPAVAGGSTIGRETVAFQVGDPPATAGGTDR